MSTWMIVALCAFAFLAGIGMFVDGSGGPRDPYDID